MTGKSVTPVESWICVGVEAGLSAGVRVRVRVRLTLTNSYLLLEGVVPTRDQRGVVVGQEVDVDAVVGLGEG